MSETPRHPMDRYMRRIFDGSVRFVPPAGSAYTEDQLAKIAHRMSQINSEIMMRQQANNHPNQQTK